MKTAVAVNVQAHSATHVATNMLRSLRQIIRDTGLSVQKMVDQWDSLEEGVETWLQSEHLQALILEVYDPSDRVDDRRGRFDFTIEYRYYTDGDGELWLDPDTVRQAIVKNGSFPSQCTYRFVADVADGAPDVPGWQSTTLRSTAGFTRHTVGTAVAGGSLGAGLSYYRRS